MNNPYDLHSWSTQYRLGRLQEAQGKNLLATAKADREATATGGKVIEFLRRVLSALLAGAGTSKTWRVWP